MFGWSLLPRVHTGNSPENKAFEKLCDELAEFEIFDSDNEDKHHTEVAEFVMKKMGDAFAAGYAAGQSERGDD